MACAEMATSTLLQWALGALGLGALGLLLLYIAVRLVTAAYYRSRNEAMEERKG